MRLKKYEREWIEILLDDWFLVFEYLTDVSVREGLNKQEALVFSFNRFEDFRKKIPLKMAVSNNLFGDDIREIDWVNDLRLSDIVNDEGELAGPPYYYIYLDENPT